MQSAPAVKYASEFPLLTAVSTADVLDACPVLTVFPRAGLCLYLDFFFNVYGCLCPLSVQYPQKPQGAQDPLELEVQTLLAVMWVLRTEPGLL